MNANKSILLFFIALIWSVTSMANKPENQPNFLFIVVDDLGWADVGYNGSTFYETPNIDQLSTEGMLFTNGYVASPMCSPTRASIMTGKYPARLHLTNWIGAPQPNNYKWNTILRSASYIKALPLKEVTLAESMKAGGYQTYFIGKWHLGKPEKFWPEHQGFDTNIAGCGWGAPIGGNHYFSPYGNPRLTDGPEGEHLPARLAKEEIAFLKSEHHKPFFSYLAFYSVHSPWMGRKDLVAKYEKKEKQPDEWRQERWIKFDKTQNNPVYAAMIEAVDIAIGNVLNTLKETGLDKNTVVIFVSDNGGASEVTSNDPLRAGKCFLYEGGIRVPLIVRWPGKIIAGSITNVPVTSTDFYPTILEMAGLPLMPEKHKDGVSFAPLLKGEKYSQRDLFWHYPHYEGGSEPASAIRSGNWKLIEFYEGDRVELYNLKDDIGEYHNLALKYPERTKILKEKLQAWRNEVKASEPTINPKFDPFKTQNYQLRYMNMLKEKYSWYKAQF